MRYLHCTIIFLIRNSHFDLYYLYTNTSEKIVSNVKLLYKQKGANDTTAGYVKSALDYQALEVLCDLFKEQKMSVDGKGSFKMEKQ